MMLSRNPRLEVLRVTELVLKMQNVLEAWSVLKCACYLRFSGSNYY